MLMEVGLFPCAFLVDVSKFPESPFFFVCRFFFSLFFLFGYILHACFHNRVALGSGMLYLVLFMCVQGAAAAAAVAALCAAIYNMMRLLHHMTCRHTCDLLSVYDLHRGLSDVQNLPIPRTDDLYDLYDLFPLRDLDLPGTADRFLICMIYCCSSCYRVGAV